MSKKLTGISYDELLKFILENVEYTYNVSKCLKEFINYLGETGAETGVFFMTKEKEHFEIDINYKILNENTDDEEIKYTYDVKKIE